MTKVIVFSGICGFSTEIVAERADKRRINIRITSECEMVRAMSNDITTLDMMEAFVGFMNNAVYKAASRHLRHVACPVPSGVLKTLEVEAGLCLPKDISIRFIKEG